MAKSLDYQKLNDELETILAAMQRDDIDVDEAMKQYGRGNEIIELLEAHLESVENQIQKLKLEVVADDDATDS